MTVLVCDISRYQMAPTSTGKVDFGAMYANGVRGVIFRATVTNTSTGVCGVDYRLNDYVLWLTEYNFLHPTERVELCGYYAAIRLERSIDYQADILLEALRGMPERRIAVDLEGTAPYGLTPEVAADRLDDWMIMTGASVIYSTALWFENFIAPRAWSTYYLWPARYPGLLAWNQPAIAGPWADGRYQWRDWQTWQLWQYGTPSVGLMLGVESLEIDCNVWNGTEEELYAWAMGEEVVPETPAQIIIPAGVNVRDNVWGNIYAKMLRDTPAKVTGEQVDETGRQWLGVDIPATVAGWVVKR